MASADRTLKISLSVFTTCLPLFSISGSRGMKFENVQTLTDAISDIILDMKWCWVDQAGVICKQDGIFRVNCMDCLDRTNVVQAAIARVVMEQQLKKLGVLPPEQPLPVKCYRLYQMMWANNGDAISRQYAGTAALKVQCRYPSLLRSAHLVPLCGHVSYYARGGISLEGRTAPHVLARGSLTAIRYRDEILRPLVRPYDGAVVLNAGRCQTSWLE
ncbi:unnamed protein product [Ranitomeya imitator]|uniref:SAC domain-containing protein n=1 Tax=Ranitomeya imitator TaxID=111125 RepID=A0ABN9KV10_9NEOB|nr:unnamed protein product [Ranitomeya imitator]